jgi:hypothetical protein
LNNQKIQITGDDYGIFNKKQSKTEIAKAFANLILSPADVNVPVKPESQTKDCYDDERKTQFVNRPCSMMHQKNYHVVENKTKNLVKILKQEMDYFETVNI